MKTTRYNVKSLPCQRLTVPGLWFCFRLLPLLTACMLGLILLQASVARAADDVPGAGRLLLHSPGLPPVPALMQRRALEVSISGMVAVFTLEQRFHNTSDQWPQPVPDAGGPIPDLYAAAHAPGVASLWAPERIEQILDQRHQDLREDKVRAEVLGQSPQAFAYPQTATTAGAKLFLGCLLLFIALLFWVMRGPEVDHVPGRQR